MGKKRLIFADVKKKSIILLCMVLMALPVVAQNENATVVNGDNGGKTGRKVGSTKSEETKKEEYKKVLKELRNGTSVRKTAKLCDVSVSTVQRLKKEFNL